MRTQTKKNTHEIFSSMSDEEVLLLNELALRMGYEEEGGFCLPVQLSSIESEIQSRFLGRNQRPEELQVKAA